MTISWTEDQKKIIDSRGKNILVSASAGSGKTTVMIQRIIDLVLDKDDRTPISKFLIVTFTKASAQDMKKKLVEAFLQHEDDEFCLEQIDDVDTSDISNLHSFCSRLISSYFYEVNVDPSFQVLDGSVSSFLQDKAIQRLFERKEKNGDKDYFKLYDIFQKKRQDKKLKNIIKRFNNFLNSNLDSEKWFFDTLEKVYSLDFEKNSCANVINNSIANKSKQLVETFEKFADFCLKNNQEKVSDYFMEIADLFKTVNFNNSYEVNAKNIFGASFPSSPRVSGSVEIKPQIETMRDFAKSQFENFQKNYISDDMEFLRKGLAEMKSVALALFGLVKEFNEIYDDLKREINGLDFNDLERKTLEILKNTEILESLKEKYKYIFVDEYQDINSVQEAIISLLSKDNNRFMVGDIKQSIYRFRLCDPDIFLDKYEKYAGKYPKSELHKLNCNFRSDKKILRFVDRVFSGVMTEDFGGVDYEKDSKFVPGENNLDNEKSVNLFFVDTTKDKKEEFSPEGVYSVQNHEQPELDEEEKGVIEAKLVANTIAKLAEKEGIDKFELKNVAVLVGSRNAMVLKFIESLKSFGIKVSSDEKYNLIEKVYVQEILNFVKLACNKNQDFVLFKVLKSRLFAFSDDDLVKIRLISPKKRFFECLEEIETLADENLKNKLQYFNMQLSKFSELAKILNIKQLCKKIIEDFSLYQINSASTEYERANHDIDLMIDALPETEPIDFVLNYDNFALEVENECGGDAVSVMTIHKSKGIEFKYVFLINTTNEFNFESTYENVMFNKDLGVGIDYFDTANRTLIETVASEGMKYLEKRKLVEEQQRVLYVALTRAKEKLFVICSKEKGKIAQKIKEHKNCYADWFEPIIYNELYGVHDDEINFECYSSSELNEKNELETREILFKEKEVETPKWFEYAYSDAKMFGLKTSISKILKNNESEEVFVGTGSSAERGTLYHSFLQKIDFKAGGIELQVERLADDFKEKNIDINLIKKLLNLPIFEKICTANYILTEREFYAKLSTDKIKPSNAQGEFILQGIIDLVAIYDDGIVVVDYKTGKCNQEKLDNYKFQLESYAEIAEKIFNKKVIKKVLCFIDELKVVEI